MILSFFFFLPILLFFSIFFFLHCFLFKCLIRRRWNDVKFWREGQLYVMSGKGEMDPLIIIHKRGTCLGWEVQGRVLTVLIISLLSSVYHTLIRPYVTPGIITLLHRLTLLFIWLLYNACLRVDVHPWLFLSENYIKAITFFCLPFWSFSLFFRWWCKRLGKYSRKSKGMKNPKYLSSTHCLIKAMDK